MCMSLFRFQVIAVDQVTDPPDEVEMAFRYRSRPIPSADAREDGTIAANEKQYLMVLGGPGVGKSTFLCKIGLEALKGENGSFEHKCIPVFLELKKFTEDQLNIEELITEEFRNCNFPDPEQMTDKTLKSGKLLILFDGLDEVPDSNIDNVVSKIGDFVDRYSQNRFNRFMSGGQHIREHSSGLQM